VASSETKIIFIHGWALNGGVWGDFVGQLLALRPSLDIQCIDLPGYGYSVGAQGADSIDVMAQYCLDEVTAPAIWVGWSLGGMVAMKAALLEPSKVLAMQLISSSPKFVASDDWPEGVDLATFELFSHRLANDYQRTLTMFLLMQAGNSTGARALARAAHESICQRPNPSLETLSAGIRCLAETDLRSDLFKLKMPIHVISGLRDRVAKPVSSARLASILKADLAEINSGHAPFMTDADAVIANLVQLIKRVSDEH
jgi:pimeloyl-[acyl-carrier protein] methyl ester esterase